MDTKTIESYNTHGKTFSERYRSAKRIPLDGLTQHLKAGDSIMEVGIGSGIDSAQLLSMGFDLTAIEPSQTLINESTAHFPELSGRITQTALPLPSDIRKHWHEQFNAILCTAVFMHIPADFRLQSMQDLSHILRPGGLLLFSVSLSRDGLDNENRDKFGRLYIPLTVNEIENFTLKSELQVIKQWDTGDQWNRRGIRWNSYLLKKKA